MAIFPVPGTNSVYQTAGAASGTSSSPIDIQAWTVSAMESVDISPLAAGTGVDMLPDQISVEGEAVAPRKPPKTARLILPYRPVASALDRTKSWKDWQKDEPTRPGNRHRRRWENAHLVGVPNVQPPQPIDFAVRPSYPVRHIPYQLANVWDLKLREEAEEAASRRQRAKKRNDRARGAASGSGSGEVPRDLRDAMKRSGATRAWVQALEEIVRTFVVRQAEGWEHVEDESEGTDGVDEDEMAVVIAEQKVRGSRTANGRLEVADLGDGEFSTYKRWLAHAIAEYYGLSSRSMKVGTGAKSRRVVQIEGGSKPPPSPALLPIKSSTCSVDAFLPRPLSEICQVK